MGQILGFTHGHAVTTPMIVLALHWHGSGAQA
jgi:hypothetical protein